MQHKIQADSSFWIMMALLILTLPMNWVAAALLAAAFHELCHLGMLNFFRIPIYGFRIRAGGVVLDTGPMGDREELICALAGPLGSFLLLIPLHIAPRVAICGLVQGGFNLLPLGNLDGGRAARCAIRLIHGKSPCKEGKMRVQ